MEISTLATKKRRLKHALTTLVLFTALAAIQASIQTSSGETSSQPPIPPLWSILEDADQDGMTDVDELLWGMDPFNPEDGLSDLDGDDISLAWEFAIGTNPDEADTDMDGWSDSEEYLLYGTDPLDPLSFPESVAPDGGEITDPPNPSGDTSEPEPPPQPPPSLSNGDFSDVGITTWKSMLNSTEYQGGGFKWNAGAITSWTAYVGTTMEVWDAGGEKFVELDGSPGNYGIKQAIANPKTGGYVLAWKQSGRNSTRAGSDPYCVRVYYMNGTSEELIAQSNEFSGFSKMQWTDNALAFQITPKQLATANGNPIYVAFIPTGSSLNTYGTLIDKVNLLPMDLDLDVNGDGDLDDSCDGLTTYLPGYQGDKAILHTGTSFKDLQFDEPQAMKLIITGLGTSAVDSATFKILNPTSYFGYCGNAIAKGGTDKDEAVNSGADFSFAAAEDDFEIQGTIATDQIWAPIYCKDYGAWCQVEITLKKNGTVIGTPTLLTLPLDINGDKLADSWQDAENLKWNAQFNPVAPRQATDADRALVNPDLDSEEADPDGRNGDGGRDLPAMATTGDGLRIREEYRGFILDGGPGITTPGQHKRLSIARKEMLVECSVEAGIVNAGENTPALAAFAVPAAMADVSAFYREPVKGASIDLYWVEDDLIQPGPGIFYQGNAFHAKGAREWWGKCEYERIENGVNTSIYGPGVPIWDEAWRSFAPDAHDKFYKGVPETHPISKLQQDNRNPNLERFVKLLLPSRIGQLRGGTKIVNGVAVIDPQMPRWLGDESHSIGTFTGARIAVAAMADEGIGYQVYWDILHRHFTPDEFNRLIRRVMAHELGHLIHNNHSGTEHGDTIMDDTNMVLSDGTVRELAKSQWHESEIIKITLPGKSSGTPAP